MGTLRAVERCHQCRYQEVKEALLGILILQAVSAYNMTLKYLLQSLLCINHYDALCILYNPL